MTLTDKEITELFSEVVRELEAIERLIQRNFPDFQHPLLAKIRAVI
jgi:hypothetical protein